MKTIDMLGKRITAMRSRKGMSQAQLAKALNVSASTIGMYEQGRRDPGLDMLVSLSQVLEVSVDFLLTGRDNAYAGQHKEIRFRVVQETGDPDSWQCSNDGNSPITIVCDEAEGVIICLT